MTDRYFDSAGVAIRYVVLGSGTPVLLAHSYLGNFEGQFVRSGLAGALANDYRVVGFDLRGHGKSGKPHDPALYGREMAYDIARLLDHLEIAKAHILGYSLGAHVVAQLMTLHPERFITAILGGACGRREWSEADDRRVEIEADEMERGMLHTQVARLRPPGSPMPGDAAIRAYSAKYLAGNDALALAAVRRSNRDQVVRCEDLAAVDVPMLGLVGSEDPYIARFHSLAQIVPRFRVDVIAGATHSNAAARPEFLDAVQRFLCEHAARADSSLRSE
jgi:pimeloyl-ACP methyl ester carboxylesterase